MTFKIVCVGKIKEQYFRDAVEEYAKRLTRFADVKVVEVAEHTFFGTPNDKQIADIKATEGKAILAQAEGYIVALDSSGRRLTSVGISAAIAAAKRNFSTLTFIIGGSHGLSDAVRSGAHLNLSLGDITLPHQLCRVVLMEQLYRATTIENNIAYHK
jgi:23S rRNA (pseudouridine1915-N3)-methyltransferase